MANEVEKIETKVAVEAVTEADKKIADIKAEKAAKKAARQNKRLGWKGPGKLVGKAINFVEDHPVATTVSFLAGVPVGVAGVLIYQKLSNKSDDVAEEATESNETEESNEAPFDTEA